MTALVLVAPGSEEIETVAIVDTLVRGGIEVVLASCCPTGARQICASAVYRSWPIATSTS